MAATKTQARKTEEPTPQLPATADKGLLLVSEEGKTNIQSNVVAKIAGLAVREVHGVSALVPFGTGQALSNLASAVTGNEKRNLGVHVDVGQVEAAVDVRIVTDYGMSIPEIANQIRTNVRTRIHDMTGLRVTEVNIDVVDLSFEEDVAAQHARRVK